MNDSAGNATGLHALLRAGEARVAQPGGPAWLDRARQRGARQARQLELPTRRDEAWRYTPLGFLERHHYLTGTGEPIGSLQLSDIEDLLLDGHTGPRLVFVNGVFAPALSSAGVSGEQGVTWSALSAAGDGVAEPLQRHFNTVAAHHHVFAALNSALMSDGALIHVAAGTRSRQPMEVLHVTVGGDDPPICHPRHLVVIDAGARAHLIERYAGLGDSVYFNNALVEVVVGEHAELIHESLREESPAAQHLNDLHVRLEAGSRYRFVHAGLGGEWSRTDLRLTFAGEGAGADLEGLMLARDGQLNDVHLDVRHEVPGCTSRESFKGILDGRGRVVFDGRILVARDAQQTDAALSNHNLMLSRQAEVDTKPQLEIYADDVKCSHGTTVGELDADMLFYLRARGIPEARAKRMLCQAFAQEVLERFESAALRARVVRLFDGRLAGSVASRGDA